MTSSLDRSWSTLVTPTERPAWRAFADARGKSYLDTHPADAANAAARKAQWEAEDAAARVAMTDGQGEGYKVNGSGETPITPGDPRLGEAAQTIIASTMTAEQLAAGEPQLQQIVPAEGLVG